MGPELLNKVILLSHPRQVIAMKRVCKHFHKECKSEPLWKRILRMHYPGIPVEANHHEAAMSVLGGDSWRDLPGCVKGIFALLGPRFARFWPHCVTRRPELHNFEFKFVLFNGENNLGNLKGTFHPVRCDFGALSAK